MNYYVIIHDLYFSVVQFGNVVALQENVLDCIRQRS